MRIKITNYRLLTLFLFLILLLLCSGCGNRSDNQNNNEELDKEASSLNSNSGLNDSSSIETDKIDLIIDSETNDDVNKIKENNHVNETTIVDLNDDNDSSNSSNEANNEVKQPTGTLDNNKTTEAENSESDDVKILEDGTIVLPSVKLN